MAALAAWLKRLAPRRWDWPWLFAGLSSYLLLIAFLGTAVAKARVLTKLHGAGALDLMPALGVDAAVLFGLAALLAMVEAAAWWLRVATWSIAAVCSALALIGAFYFAIAGAPLSLAAIRLGLERFGDLRGVLAEALRRIGAAEIEAALIVLATLPVATWTFLRRRETVTSEGDWARARAAAAMAMVGLASWSFSGTPALLPLRQLRSDALLATALQEAKPTSPARRPRFKGYLPEILVSQPQLARLRSGARTNVVLLVLESTRYDATGLASAGGASTPNLVALAARGTTAPVARAVLPHTSKSLFSMLCDRLPTMQHTLFETSTALQVQCLPGILDAAGYRTGFFQSALGFFEGRPRLVANLGFSEFKAWEDIRGAPLGYLASDDRSLAQPLFAWIDADRSRPFFATLLSSGTHHPYRLPASDSGTNLSDHQRYLRLVQIEDELIGQVVAGLLARGLDAQTLIVVVGDHGEGFGDHAIRQHDNNFYEEGLRVPLVLEGPGVPVQRVDGNASLVDVTPSILDALGIDLRRDGGGAGFSVLPGKLSDVPRWFGCYYDDACAGYVLGDEKVVVLPRSDEAIAFDLKADPDELSPKPLSARAREHLPELEAVLAASRADVRVLGVAHGAVTRFALWECPADQVCRNSTWQGGFFEPPGG